MKPVFPAALLALAIAATQARAFTITPTFVNGDTQTWDATKITIIDQAISNWERVISYPTGSGITQNIQITFDFTHAGTDSYLGLTESSYSAPLGASLYPYSADSHGNQYVTQTIHFNADLMTQASPGDDYLAFVTGQPAFAQWDALSVATHELGHVLGFNTIYTNNVQNNPTTDKWDSHITTSGSAAVFDQGGAGHLNVSLDSSDNVIHTLDGGSTANDLMNPDLLNGERLTYSKSDLNMLALAYGYTLNVIPGDANLDGLINMDDYLALDEGYKDHLTGWQNGDFNNDGSVNAADYSILDASFKAHGSTSDGGLAINPVPEPASAWLFTVGCIGLLLRPPTSRARPAPAMPRPLVAHPTSR